MSVRQEAESALVVPVPMAESVVGSWRTRLDPACRLGIPAHVTLVYPFVPPGQIDGALIDELDAVFSGVSGFDYELSGVRWFGADVVWAEPKPAEPFMQLIDLVLAEWPQVPPYEGEFDEVVPHLTIAQNCPRRDMEAAAEAVAAELPIPARADRVWLMAGSQEIDSWEVQAEFPLRS